MNKKKQKKRKNCFYKKDLSLIIVVLLIVIFFFSVEYSNNINFNNKNNDYEKIIIAERDQIESTFIDSSTKEPLTSKEIDFGSQDGGTIIGWAGENYFKEPVDDVVILFASAKIPGLTLIYYPQEEKIVGGMPQIVAKDIQLFNGEKHQVAYSFSSGGKQQIFYDGKKLAESEFLYLSDSITGATAGVRGSSVSWGFYKIKVISE